MNRRVITFTMLAAVLFTAVGTGASYASTGVPAAPDSCLGFAVSNTEVDVKWTDQSDNENGFTIYRTVAVGHDLLPMQAVGTAGANATTFRDSGLVPGTTYFYEVRAFNAQGTSNASPETFVTAPTRVIMFYLDQASYNLNGQVFAMNAPLVQVNTRNYVPLAGLTQAMGGQCRWDAATRTVTMNVESRELKFVIDSNTATLNGVAYNMPNPALIIGGYTYVPLGYVVSSLHSDCWWDPVEQKAKIFYPASTIEGV